MARLSLAILLLFALVSVTLALRKKHRPSKGLTTTTGSSVNSVNGNLKFKFPPNKRTKLSDTDIRRHPKKLRSKKHNRAAPPTFDARQKWPKCTSIGEIRNQGQCGTCWAVSSASVASDRICITSNQLINVNISANQGAGCTGPERDPIAHCEAGGDASYLYQYMAINGLPSGGGYNSKSGCVPYTPSPSTAPAIGCAKSCSNTNYATPLPTDQAKYIIESYYVKYVDSGTKMTQAQIDEVVEDIKNDIVENGPVTAAFTVYADFQKWTPAKGPYRGPAAGQKNLGGHAVRIIGWNVTPQGEPYWMISNSWGVDVGDKGLYYILMGKNVCGIESDFSAPVVKSANPCAAASFCDATTPIDQAFTADIKSSTPNIYLVKGECVQNYVVSGNGLKAKGPAVPTSRIFLNAPAAPITKIAVQSGQVLIVNDQGKASACDNLPVGGTKTQCTGGYSFNKKAPAGSDISANFVSGSSVQKWTYQSASPDWLFNTNGQGLNIEDTISEKFDLVTAILNLNGKNMMIFGKNTAGQSIAGVLPYPTKNGATLQWTQAPDAISSLLTCSA